MLAQLLRLLSLQQIGEAALLSPHRLLSRHSRLLYESVLGLNAGSRLHRWLVQVCHIRILRDGRQASANAKKVLLCAFRLWTQKLSRSVLTQQARLMLERGLDDFTVVDVAAVHERVVRNILLAMVAKLREICAIWVVNLELRRLFYTLQPSLVDSPLLIRLVLIKLMLDARVDLFLFLLDGVDLYVDVSGKLVELGLRERSMHQVAQPLA